MLSKFFKKHKDSILSVQELTIKTSGMRFTHLYKAIPKDNEIQIERYREFFADRASHLELEKSAYCTTDSFIELLNFCNIAEWDGFHGKHPKNVSDGIMFTFSATVNGNRTIRANGSENFPKGYREFVQRLDEMLNE